MVKKGKKEKIINEIDGLIDSDGVNAIYPFVIKENKEYMELGGNYARTIIFAQYPEKKNGNWLSDLKRLKGNITITQYIEPASASVMIDYYNAAIKNKNAEFERTYDPKTKVSLEKEIESSQYQLEEALNDKSGFVYIYTYILIQAKTIEEIDVLEDRINLILTKLHVKAITPYYRQMDGFWSVLPLYNNNLKEYTYQMSNTTAASSFFPFDNSEICDLSPGAQIEGINKKSNSLIAINYMDSKKTLNQNMLIIGTSGVGKTTYLERKIMSLIAQGKKVYILDPENEYTKIVKKYGGIVIVLSSMSETVINPLEFFSEEIDEKIVVNESNKMGHLAKQKAQRLKGFFKLIKEDMSQVELAVVEKVLLKLYKPLESKNIRDLKHCDFPILEDLLKECKNLEEKDSGRFNIIKDFCYILETYVYGSSSLFNGHTNIDLSSQIVSFDLSALQNEKAVQGACYLNVFSYLWEEITKMNKTAFMYNQEDYSAYLFADEFHFLLNNEESSDFFFQAYKRFRKYNAGCIVSTQQILDVLKANYKGGDVGTAITENSHTKVFFGLDNKGVNDVIEKLDMKFSKAEISLLRAKKQGEALLIYGTRRVFMKVKLTKEEMRICNPRLYERVYEKDSDIQPDYIKKMYISPLEREEIYSFGGGR